MACTTVLVGKNVSYDGSTMIARNDDSPSGQFHVKKMVVVEPKDQKKKYVSKLSKVEINLPKTSYRYTLMPNVDPKEGIWGASGINEKNVSMSATETITTNPRVLGADPYVEYYYDENKKKEVKGGIGEEDLVVLVLPYISSAREGVIRLGELLEKYGTYEPNGIAFNDKDDIWWLETIGGHHWIARRVQDDEVVIMPNQFGLDNFDFRDALGEKKNYMCSKDLECFVKNNNLNLDFEENFNPRVVFGSHDDSDHIYNTPRAWFMGRYLNSKDYKWSEVRKEGYFDPQSDDIPWAIKPLRKVTIEDVKYLLSSHFQGTDFDPYSHSGDPLKRNIYRSIGVNRTSFMSINQIRNNVDSSISAIEWICFGSNVFNALVPVYANTKVIPAYYQNTTLKVSTDNFYWTSRLIGALSDGAYQASSIYIERYQNAVASKAHELINKNDKLILDFKNKQEAIAKANEEIAAMAKEESDKALNSVLYVSSMKMKNGFSRSDN